MAVVNKLNKAPQPATGQYQSSGRFKSQGPDLTKFGRDPKAIKAQQDAIAKQMQQLRSGGRIGGFGPAPPMTPQQQEQMQQLQKQQLALTGEAASAGGEDAERARRFEQLKQFREKDLAAGRARAEEMFGEGAFGRLEGMDEGQTQGLREVRLRNLNRLQQQQQRSLAGAQAQTGIQGGLAGQQLQGLQAQQQREQQAAEQELLLGTAQQQRDVDKFNIGQQKAEILARNVRELGEAGLGAAERGAVLSQLAAEAGAAAQAKAGKGGKK